MKKVIKKSMLMLMVLFTMTNYANEMSFKTSDNEIIKTTLTLNNVKQGQRLLIKDLNGLVLYKEFISKSGTYNKVFDLTALPAGDYYFELDKEFEIQVIPFIVKNAIVTFKKEATNTIFKPVVTFKDNVVLISKLALDKEALEISIYYEDGAADNELIYSEEIVGIQTIQKAYNLSLKGKYKIVFKTEGRVFVNYFKV